MARMYPPDGPREPCQSDAERKLYSLFQKSLGPDYIVIHSVDWHNRAANGRLQEGEADFLIIHPQHGILILEVKGGRISYRDGAYHTMNRDNQEDVLNPPPIQQAMRSCKVLGRKLQGVPRTRPYMNHYRLAYGAWFPDTDWHVGRTGRMRMDDQFILDKPDQQTIDRALARLFHYAKTVDWTDATESPQPLTPEAIEALLWLLGIQPPEPYDGHWPERDPILTQIQHFTSEQHDRLQRMLGQHGQLGIPGHAGTGKTVLAMEMASRLAQSGNRTLFVCANQPLADHLNDQLGAAALPATSTFTVQSVHDLAIAVATKRGTGSRRDEVKNLSVSKERDQERLGAILAENLRALSNRGEPFVYDALLVDEAQDLNEPIWKALQLLLADPETSFFYVFYDPAQRDLPGDWDFSWTGIAEKPCAYLEENCRNTGEIYALMAEFNPDLKRIRAPAPSGAQVRYIDPRKKWGPSPSGQRMDAETRALEYALDQVIDEGKFKPHEILVITCRGQRAWEDSRKRTVGRHNLGWLGVKGERFVRLSTIRSSKGLEMPVVVLANLDALDDESEDRRDNLLYTAISRAQYVLVVLGTAHDVSPKKPGSVNLLRRLFPKRRRGKNG